MLHPVSEANSKSPYGNLSHSEFYTRHAVVHSTEYITNSRGLNLFTQSWFPLPPTKPIGFVAVVHGFTGQVSGMLELTAVFLAKSGFVACAIDHQGHGYSDSLDGLTCHIPDINPVVDDCVSYFNAFREAHASNLPSFLYGESLGGAIALLITLRRGGSSSSKPWNGIVLYGSMCGVSPNFKPPWPLERLLPLAASLLPTWHLVPTRGTILDKCFREKWKRELALATCPRKYVGRPRLGTAQELMRICGELQKRFEEVDVPFLILHGREDGICDVAGVEDLYARAASKDKTIKVYEGMWHQLVGESQENVDLVFGHMIEWLQTRARTARRA